VYLVLMVKRLAAIASVVLFVASLPLHAQTSGYLVGG
jgi:hypothetical protein